MPLGMSAPSPPGGRFGASIEHTYVLPWSPRDTRLVILMALLTLSFLLDEQTGGAIRTFLASSLAL